MFDRNKFKTACIFHGSDFDGQLSGALIRYHNRIHKNEDVLMVSADYHYDAKTIEDEILNCDTVYIVDFSLVNEEMFPMFLRMIDRGVKIFWFDHHVSAIKRFLEIQKKMPDILEKLEHVILYNGIAACRLLYAYLSSIEEDNYFSHLFKNEKQFCFNYKTETENFPHITTMNGQLLFGDNPESFDEPIFIKLLGKYDVFDKTNIDEWKKEIFPFQYGMRLEEITSPKTIAGFSVWKSLFDECEIFRRMSKSDFSDNLKTIDKIIEKGKIVLNYQNKMATGYIHSFGHCYNFMENMKAIVVNVGQANSTFFECYNNEECEYDLFVAWIYTGDNNVKVSLFKPERSDIKCNEIAEKFGGGGHPGAAGFKTDLNHFFSLLTKS